MVKRNRPLDFAAVTDHAEYMGVSQCSLTPITRCTRSRSRPSRSTDPADGQEAPRVAGAIAGLHEPDPELVDPKIVGPMWKRVQEFAEQPTTRASSRRSSRSSGLDAQQQQPASQRDFQRHGHAGTAIRFDASTRPEDLWTYSTSPHRRERRDRDSTQCEPQQRTDVRDQGLGRQAVHARVRGTQDRMEPLQEVIQLKGASETAPSLAPTTSSLASSCT